MTVYSMTVSNSLDLFGVAPTDNWNAYNWNAFLWGEGTEDLPIVLNPKYVDAGSVTLDSSVGILFTKQVGVDNELVFVVDMESETLSDSAGYDYVFPDRTSEAEDRSFATWAAGAAASSSWVTATAASTSWS